MGFFSDILAPIAGGVGGFLLGGPAGAIDGAGLGLQLTGQQKQEEAISEAQRTQEGALDFQQNLTLQLLAEGKPLREAQTEASLRSLELLRGDIEREPGTGPLFTSALERGTESIFSNLAPFGLTDSSTAGTAVGRFGADLTAADMAQLTSDRFRLAGFGPNLTGLGVGQAGGTANAFGNVADLQLLSGVNQANLFGDIGNLGVAGGTGLFDLSNFQSPFGRGTGGNTFLNPTGGFSAYPALTPSPAPSSFSGPFDLTGGR